MVPCINSKPFIYSELLMTLPDLVTHFFPSVPLSSCRQVLQDVLGLDLYRGNRCVLYYLYTICIFKFYVITSSQLQALFIFMYLICSDKWRNFN
jgi:hypothetical protein